MFAQAVSAIGRAQLTKPVFRVRCDVAVLVCPGERRNWLTAKEES
jgi:hypothetical protein